MELTDWAIMEIRSLLSDRIGYILPIEFRAFIERQIKQLMQERKIADLQELIIRLKRDAVDTKLWHHFISRMTIGESYFFRNPNHMKLLKESILPKLIEKAKEEEVWLWSAGCARGEEPYTLAILMHELEPKICDLPIKILATDIDQEALEYARKGEYGSWAFRETPYYIQRGYFQKVDKKWRIRESLKGMVEFMHHHLSMELNYTWGPRHGFDLILCRNVMMYLRKDFREMAGLGMSKHLGKSGLLLPGQVERVDGVEGILDEDFIEDVLIYSKHAFREENVLLQSLLKGHGSLREIHEKKNLEKAKKRVSKEGEKRKKSEEKREALKEEQKGFKRKAQKPMVQLDGSEHYQKIHEMLRNGDFKGALRYGQMLIMESPLNAEYYCLLALIYIDRDKYLEAIESLRRAIYSDPNHLTAFYLWWLIGIRYFRGKWRRMPWIKRHLRRLIEDLPEEEQVPLLSRVTVGDIKYLLNHSSEMFGVE